MNTIQKISLKFIEHQKNRSYNNSEFNSNATADWIINNSNEPWLKINLDVPHQAIECEIHKIKKYFVPHRDEYSEHSEWKAFCIHGKSFDSTREDSYYNDARPHEFTKEAIEFMPNTVNFFKQFKNTSFQRIRVMELAPGGLISIHQDGKLPGKLHPINIAITQPAGCDFVMENYGVIPFSVGDSYMLNVCNRHAVYNNSSEYRYHIIMHYSRSESIDNLVVNSYNTNNDNLCN